MEGAERWRLAPILPTGARGDGGRQLGGLAPPGLLRGARLGRRAGRVARRETVEPGPIESRLQARRFVEGRLPERRRLAHAAAGEGAARQEQRDQPLRALGVLVAEAGLPGLDGARTHPDVRHYLAL